jgi:hypothetical protein
MRYKEILREADDFDDDEDEDESRYAHLPSIQVVNALRPRIAAEAQRVYDKWAQDENDDLNGGGICHLIAEEAASLISTAGVPVATQCSSYEQHVYCICQCQEGIYEVDIPYSLYERGGGFTWTKLPDVEFTADDVAITKLDYNPGKMGDYVEEWEDWN